MGVQRMASEDSVENLLLRNASVLAVPVDGVGKAHKPHDSFDTSLPAFTNKLDSGGEDLVVDSACGKPHVVPKKGYDHVPQDTPIRDLQHQHVLIPWFREDRARAELLCSQFKEASSIPVLIEKELRLDEVAERSS
jgi:hypothetical protein